MNSVLNKGLQSPTGDLFLLGGALERASVKCLFSTVLYVPVDFTIDYQINIFHYLSFPKFSFVNKPNSPVCKMQILENILDLV